MYLFCSKPNFHRFFFFSLNHIESLRGSQSLLEVTLDNNPVAEPVAGLGGDQSSNSTSRTNNSSSVNASGTVTYRQRVICQIANLRQLDMKRITVSVKSFFFESIMVGNELSCSLKQVPSTLVLLIPE